MAIGSPSSQCINWKWGKVKHRRPDNSAAVWHISASYVCITALSSVIAGWAGSGDGGGRERGGLGVALQMGLWQHISASLNILIMFTSEIVTWAHLTWYEIFRARNEQRGWHTQGSKAAHNWCEIEQSRCSNRARFDHRKEEQVGAVIPRFTA